MKGSRDFASKLKATVECAKQKISPYLSLNAQRSPRFDTRARLLFKMAQGTMVILITTYSEELDTYIDVKFSLLESCKRLP
ncbi:hypothetical protein AC249_AIPGENE4886 [Exaiptasia diaphana]|nr:hypothetical protein AC249_AIPGENE4886 [Exaiptasia diaphana]